MNPTAESTQTQTENKNTQPEVKKERAPETREERNVREAREAFAFATRQREVLRKYLNETKAEDIKFNPQDLIRLKEGIKRLERALVLNRESSDIQELLTQAKTSLNQMQLESIIKNNLVLNGYGEEVNFIENAYANEEVKAIDTSGVNSFIVGMLGKEAVGEIGLNPDDKSLNHYLETINPEKLMELGSKMEGLAVYLQQKGGVEENDPTLNELLTKGQILKQKAALKGETEISYTNLEGNPKLKIELLEFMLGNSRRAQEYLTKVKSKDWSNIDRRIEILGKQFVENLAEEGGLAALGLLTDQSEMVTDLYGKVGEVARNALFGKFEDQLPEHLKTYLTSDKAKKLNDQIRTETQGKNPQQQLETIAQIISRDFKLGNKDTQSGYNFSEIFEGNGDIAAVCAVRTLHVLSQIENLASTENLSDFRFTVENKIEPIKNSKGETELVGHTRVIMKNGDQYFVIDTSTSDMAFKSIEPENLPENIKRELESEFFEDSLNKSLDRANANMMVNFAYFADNDAARFQLLNAALKTDPDNILALSGLAEYYRNSEHTDIEKENLFNEKLESLASLYNLTPEQTKELKGTYEAWEIGGTTVESQINGLGVSNTLKNALKSIQREIDNNLLGATNLQSLNPDNARDIYQRLLDVYDAFKPDILGDTDTNNLFQKMAGELLPRVRLAQQQQQEGIPGIFNLSQGERTNLEKENDLWVHSFVEREIRNVTQELAPGRALPEAESSLAQRRLTDIITVLQARTTSGIGGVDEQLKEAKQLNTAVLKLAQMSNLLETLGGNADKMNQVKDSFAGIDSTEGVTSMEAIAKFSEGRVNKILPLMEFVMMGIRDRYEGFISGANYNLLLGETVDLLLNDAVTGTGLYGKDYQNRYQEKYQNEHQQRLDLLILQNYSQANPNQNLNTLSPQDIQQIITNHKSTLNAQTLKGMEDKISNDVKGAVRKNFEDFIRGDAALAQVLLINAGTASSIAQVGVSVKFDLAPGKGDLTSSPFLDWIPQTWYRYDTLSSHQREYMYTYLKKASVLHLEDISRKNKGKNDKAFHMAERVLNDDKLLAQYIEREGFYIIAPYAQDFWSSPGIRIRQLKEAIDQSTGKTGEFGVFLQFVSPNGKEDKVDIGKEKIIKNGYSDILMRQMYAESMTAFYPLKGTAEEHGLLDPNNHKKLYRNPEEFKIFSEFWAGPNTDFLEQIGVADGFTFDKAKKESPGMSDNATLARAQYRFQIFERYLSPLITTWRTEAMSINDPTNAEHRNFGNGLSAEESNQIQLRFKRDNGSFIVNNIDQKFKDLMHSMEQHSLNKKLAEELVYNPIYEHIFRNPLSTIDSPWSWLESKAGNKAVSITLGKGNSVGRYIGDEANFAKSRSEFAYEFPKISVNNMAKIMESIAKIYDPINQQKGYDYVGRNTVLALAANYFQGMVPGLDPEFSNAMNRSVWKFAEMVGFEGLTGGKSTPFSRIFGPETRKLNRDNISEALVAELAHLLGADIDEENPEIKSALNWFKEIVKLAPANKIGRAIIQVIFVIIAAYISQIMEKSKSAVGGH